MSDAKIIRQRLTDLRNRMKAHQIDAYLVVSDDFHGSEYVGDYFKCREFLSGFDGSAGTLLITDSEAGLWTDGRYFLQAEQQLKDTGISLFRMGQKGVPKLEQYLKDNLQEGMVLAYDGRTINSAYALLLKQTLSHPNIIFIEDVDLVDEIWKDRPGMPATQMWELPLSYAGQTRGEKLARLQKEMETLGADYHVLASLDDIAWLYNFRGNDIAYNPVCLAYTLVSRESAFLYVNPDILSDQVRNSLQKDRVTIRPYYEFFRDLQNLPSDKRMLGDPEKLSVAVVKAFSKKMDFIRKTNPTTMFKAVKNPVEMQNVREAHRKDGIALTKLLYWLKHIDKEEQVTELDISAKLLSLRKQQEDFVEESFASIIASGPHGAIIHYEPTTQTNAQLDWDTLLLMDTGGHYLQGTTDVTRTIAIGQISHQQKEHYTAVLRGNLQLGAAIFKHGYTGTNLEILARMPLWEQGMDYNHGTGHGVGYLLNVHEGPCGFRQKEAGNRVGPVLEEGMIISNEPGFYLDGSYGIRLENLVLCLESGETTYGKMMHLETLTMVPFDRDAILAERLSEREKSLLNEYHKRVYQTLCEALSPEECRWLAKVTAPIG